MAYEAASKIGLNIYKHIYKRQFHIQTTVNQ